MALSRGRFGGSGFGNDSTSRAFPNLLRLLREPNVSVGAALVAALFRPVETVRGPETPVRESSNPPRNYLPDTRATTRVAPTIGG